MSEPKKFGHITLPEQLRQLSIPELEELAEEIRSELISTITQVGGHLAPSLGAVELTIALHKVFDTPRDKLVWDVGHQAYPHKMLTGRRGQLSTIRQLNGISGFLKRGESEYDAFGAGHASTAISAAFGMACARDLAKENYKVVAIIGDGAMTGGLAYEAINNAGISNRDLLVILNDNKMSISPNVGAISRYLVNILTNPHYQKARDEIWGLTERLPGKETVRHVARRIEEGVKALVSPGALFEDFGFRYIGPVNGHNLELLIPVLQRIRTMRGPILLHTLTVKGKGWEKAENDPVKYHGVKGIQSAKSAKTASYARPVAPDEVPGDEKPSLPTVVPSYMDAFGKIMIELAEHNSKVIAISAAMSEGTGLSEFAGKRPGQFFDVGIAEAHGVCFAAGMATQGVRPVCAIYSTFLQRAFDQIVHDVALQHLPVIFAIDRAGLVGEDGPTHHGCIDISYLTLIPEMIVSCPKDGDELYDLLITALGQKDRPFSIRYPKESAVKFTPGRVGLPLPIGSWEELSSGKEITVIATGAMVVRAERAVNELRAGGSSIGLVNARFIKPIDEKLLMEISKRTKRLVVIEENVPTGGLISQVRCQLTNCHIPIDSFTLPDRYIEQGKRDELLELSGLSAVAIKSRIQTLLANDGGTGTAG